MIVVLLCFVFNTFVSKVRCVQYDVFSRRSAAAAAAREIKPRIKLHKKNFLSQIDFKFLADVTQEQQCLPCQFHPLNYLRA